MTTKEAKAPTAEDVERDDRQVWMGTDCGDDHETGCATCAARHRLRDAALLGVQVPGLREQLEKEEHACADAMQERDAALEVIEQTASDLGCEQEWTNLHDHRQCLHERVSALQAQVAELEVQLAEHHERARVVRESLDGCTQRVLVLKSERDALRAQVEVARNAFGEISTTCEQKSLLGPPQDGLSSKLLGAVDYVWKVARAQYDSLSTPLAKEKKLEPARKRSCNAHDDCDTELGTCCNDAMCSDHQ